MKRAFVTLLATPDFIPGLLALNQSLKLHNPNHNLVTLVTKKISNESINLLKEARIIIKEVDEIPNPFLSKDDERGFIHTYTKLRIFDLIEFSKIVYLDIDMVICDNIELLFEKQHMSAVIAGRNASGNKNWCLLNSGLMVIEPNRCLFEELIFQSKKLHSIDQSDQGFLQSFFVDWPNQRKLHLSERYNLPAQYLDEYCLKPNFNFSFNKNNFKLNVKNISVIHFWGPFKPWHFKKEHTAMKSLTKYQQAINLWWYFYGKKV